MSNAFRFFACLACALAYGSAPSLLAAQATEVRGVIRGEAGTPLPGATVTATDTNGDVVGRVESDEQGRFVLPGLPAGEYEIEANFPGLTPATAAVSLAAGETRLIEIALALPPFTDAVTVTRASQDRAAVPQAVVVVGEEEIQLGQRQESLADPLRAVPGMFAEDRRNLSLSGGVRAAIRAPMIGFGMRGVQIIQDGIPLTTADGTTNPNNVDLGSAGEIEVVRGPSSVLYGNSAGGVITLRTEFPSSRRLSIEPDLQLGSYGYERQQLKAEGRSSRLGYLFNVNRMETDGFRRHNSASVRRANLVLRATLSDATEMRGVFNLFDMPFAENASTLTLEDARNDPRSVRELAIEQGWGESATQGQGGVTIEHRLGAGQRLRGTGWALWRDVWNPIPFRIVDLGRRAAGFRSEYAGSAQLGRFPIDWTAGFDASYQRDKRIERENEGGASGSGRTRAGARLLDQGEEVLSMAPFAQVSVGLHPRWLLTAGARYDYYDFSARDRFLSDGDQSGGRTLDAASPMVGLTFAATSYLSLYTHFATAYHTPTTLELSNRPSGEGGFNEDLEPATLRSVEVGARGSLPLWRLQYEVAGYRSTLDNAFVELQRPDEQTFFQNTAESSRNGIEARVEWAPVRRLRARLAYTYRDFDFERFRIHDDDFSGNREPGAPPHQLFLGGSYETALGLRTAAQLRWVDAYPVNNGNTVANWSYRVVDLRLGLTRRWKGLDVLPFLGIDNLFGERYNASTIPNSLGARFFEPAPGREMYVGIRVGAGLF